MATIVEMINPLTGLPEQVDKLDHTAQEIDDAVGRSLPGAAIDASIQAKPNPNLLDNWYFVNPVNQRGVSGTISTTGYFIDGWKLVSGTVQITSAGLVLNGTIEQILESGIGQPVKATFLASDGVFDASYNGSTKTFTITATGKTLIAAALELGEHQAHFSQDSSGNWILNEIPDYGEQLARCQRYYIELNTLLVGYPYVSIMIAESTTVAIGFIDLPVSMRTLPSVITSGEWRLYDPSDKTRHIASSIALGVSATNGVLSKIFLNVTTTDLVNGRSYFLSGNGTGQGRAKLAFSAEL